MRLHDRLPLHRQIGLDGIVTSKGYRQVTLLSGEQWRDVQAELGVALPWYERRANVLTEGIELRRLIGSTIQLGTAVVAILDELEPCKRMHDIHPGLYRALVPEMRGGVFGRIERSGSVWLGSEIRVVDEQVEQAGRGPSQTISPTLAPPRYTESPR